MHDIWALWGLLLRYAIGVGVFAFVMYFALRTISRPWRKMADLYAGQPQGDRISRRFPETVAFAARVEGAGKRSDRKRWYAYAAVRMDLHDESLVLSTIFPFTIMCRPLVLPLSEIALSETWWLTLQDPVAIRMKRAPDVDMIVRGSAARWLRDARDHAWTAPGRSSLRAREGLSNANW